MSAKLSKRGTAIRVVGAGLIGVSAAVLSGYLGLTAGSSDQSHDFGIGSALAVVADLPANATQATVEIANVSPEPDAGGRLSVQISSGGFESDGAVQPTDSVTPQSGHGFAVVLGGDLAAAVDKCDQDYAVARKGLGFSALTETERNTIVANITAQLKDRTVTYGDPSGGPITATPVELAARMSYTRIEFSVLVPYTWTMNANTAVTTSSGASSQVNATGFFGIAQCDLDQSRLLTRQTWGLRWEVPPITVSQADANAGSSFQAEAIRIIHRTRATPDFVYSASSSFANSSINAFAGMSTATDHVDIWSAAAGSPAIASVDQGSLNFQNANYTQERDLALFAAGAAASLAASMLIAILKTVAKSIPLLSPRKR